MIPLLKNWILKDHHDDNLFYTNKQKFVMYCAFNKAFDNKALSIFNMFVLKNKKNFATQKELYCDHLNYFLKYFDKDSELITHYLRIKVMIDTKGSSYNRKTFLNDIYMLLLSDSIVSKITAMTERNYEGTVETTKPSMKNKVEVQQFTDAHCKALLNVSMNMKFIIPLLSHYSHMNNIKKNFKQLIHECFDMILDKYSEIHDFNLYIKLYGTVKQRLMRTANTDTGHWFRVAIDGDDILIKAEEFTRSLIESVVHKYVYDRKLISLNVGAIEKNLMGMRKDKTKYSFRSMSTMAENEDGLSDFDRIEMNQSHFDESTVIIRQVNINHVLKSLTDKYDIELDEDEVQFYMKNSIPNPLQRELMFQFFAKYFGSVQALYSINIRGYAILIIIMKEMLFRNGFRIMQHILSGKIILSGNRRIVNKKMMDKVVSSPVYKQFISKYRHTEYLILKDKSFQESLNKIFNSRIIFIDYELSDSEGKTLRIQDNQNLICDEFIKFMNMI